jgi:hypothetical protein
MREHAQEEPSPEEHAARDAVPDACPMSQLSTSFAVYQKVIDNARGIVAIAAAICGAGYIVSLRRDDYLRLTLRTDSGIWAWGCSIFGIGLEICCAAVLLLIVEHLAQPATRGRLWALVLLLRSLVIVLIGATICSVMAYAFGPGQAVGSTIGASLILAAVRQRHTARFVLAGIATVVLVLTLLSTQSAFQYARRHSDAIVDAGYELMERCSSADDYTYNQAPECDPDGLLALRGQEIRPDDPRVPRILRNLGARRIWVGEERVAVYVGVDPFDFHQFPRPNLEFQIYRSPHPAGRAYPVWGSRGKDEMKITDRLWTNSY